MSSPRIDVIVGTRPEAIKIAPVAAALGRRGLSPRLIFTGQHPLSPSDYGLGDYDRILLDCPGQDDPHAHAGAIARAVAPLLADRPRLLIAQGDTASALGGALAAFAADVPVAHVEAGLRSFDPAMPWPEEGFRTMIDANAALLFAPTEINAVNLEAEGVAGSIFVTGNTGIDALLAVAPQQGSSVREAGKLRLLVTCHRRESWGAGLRSIAEMKASDILLSDSGGLQEEAPALGLPMLVLRDKTERPEGFASGNMLLVGTNQRRIVEGVVRLLDPAVRAAMGRPVFPFGDGRSADRIAAHVADFLAAGSAEPDRARRA